MVNDKSISWDNQGKGVGFRMLQKCLKGLGQSSVSKTFALQVWRFECRHFRMK